MATQCKGTTKAGKRCRITSNLVNGYCRLHQDQAHSQPEPQHTEPEPSENAYRSDMCDSSLTKGACILFCAAVVLFLVVLLFKNNRK